MRIVLAGCRLVVLAVGWSTDTPVIFTNVAFTAKKMSRMNTMSISGVRLMAALPPSSRVCSFTSRPPGRQSPR